MYDTITKNFGIHMRHHIALACTAAVGLMALFHRAKAENGQIIMTAEGTNTFLQVLGNPGDEWRFQSSEDLVAWTNAPHLGSVLAEIKNSQSLLQNITGPSCGFIRALKSDGLFDVHLLRTIHLTFTNSNWASLLIHARESGSNVPCALVLDNGVAVANVGARYRGNTSYVISPIKKSVNLDINYEDPNARVMGYRTLNLNNAANDKTIMREPVYFNVMREYAPCPHGALVKLIINGEYWGVYSMVDQLNNDLLDEWFPSHNGDRWRVGNQRDGISAFWYLGAAVSNYADHYILKSGDSTNAWERLVHAIDVLNNSPANQLRDLIENVFAVDRWLWFLAIENIFVDDDSYWKKGADYGFYYEPESGRIHPVEHDGNETFASVTPSNFTLSPVPSAGDTNRPLLNKLLSIPELRQRYLAHMRAVLDERYHPNVLTPVIDHYHHLSVAAIILDSKKDYTMAAYTNDLAALKTHITNRYNFLINHDELRPLPPNITAVCDPSPLPGPSDIPFITARVQANGAEGIDSVWLYWRDTPYGRFSVAQMFDDGVHQDGAANDGLFGAATTNYPAGHKIHYYIEARSANSAKAAAFSPARAEQDTYGYRVSLITATNTPVVINELMADNQQTIADPQGDFDDWIELRNLTNQSVDLTGCYLTDDPTNPRKWPFPAETIIPANGYLVVWADENGSDTPGLHAGFKLDKSGEQVLLIDLDANLNAVLDSVTFAAQETNRSWGRSPNNPDLFISMQPTPGQSNISETE